MNERQKQAATQSMVEWLDHPQELGKRPVKIECVGEFELHEMHYYIFKYKISLFGGWMLGVCGGFEGDELEHCGHVLSEMKEYHSATAEKEAIKMVELIRAYWMRQATDIRQEEYLKKA